MSAGDKRSVSTDALETLGTILGDGCGRDAIHLAVEPVIAGHRLDPGADVGLVDGKAVVCDKPLGIVDPFLKKTVRAGERFWLVVYPRQITSLRHVWTHPAFTESIPEAKTASDMSDNVEFIKDAAERIGVSFESLMVELKYYLDHTSPSDTNKCIGFGEEIEARDLPDGFWVHYESLTGRTVPSEMRDVYFRCAC